MSDITSVALRAPSGQGIAGPNVKLQGAANSALTRANAGTANLFGRMADIEAQKLEILGTTKRNQAIADGVLAASKDFHEFRMQSRKEINPDGSGHAQGFTDHSQQFVEDAVAAFQEEHGNSPRAQEAAQAYRDRLEGMAFDAYTKEDVFEEETRIGDQVTRAKAAMADFEALAVDDPDSALEHFDAGIEDIEARDIPQSEKDRLQAQLGKGIAAGMAEATLSDDPGGMDAAMEGKMAQDHLSAAQRESYKRAGVKEVERLERQAQQDRDRAEAKARAARQAEVGVLEDAAKDAGEVYDRSADPAGADAVRAGLRDAATRFAGTLEGDRAQRALDGLESQEAEASVAQDFTGLTAVQGQAVIDEMKKGPQTPDSLDAIERFEKIQDENEKAFANGDGMERGQEIGIIGDLMPVDPTNLDPAALAARSQQARAVEEHFGRTDVNPFTSAEIDAMRQGLAEASAEEALDQVAQLGALPDDQYNQVIDAISQDRPSLGFAADVMREGDKALAIDILRGEKMRDEGAAKEASGVELDDAIQESIGSAFSSSPEMMGQIIDAAKSVYAVEMTKAGTPNAPFDADVFEGAMERVTGGPMATWNGKKVPPPPGMTPEEFKKTLANLPPDTPKMYDADDQVIPFDVLKEDGIWLWDEYVELVPIGKGKYHVLYMGKSKVFDIDGEDYILNLDPTDPEARPATPATDDTASLNHLGGADLPPRPDVEKDVASAVE